MMAHFCDWQLMRAVGWELTMRAGLLLEWWLHSKQCPRNECFKRDKAESARFLKDQVRDSHHYFCCVLAKGQAAAEWLRIEEEHKYPSIFYGEHVQKLCSTLIHHRLDHGKQVREFYEMRLRKESVVKSHQASGTLESKITALGRFWTVSNM